METNRNLLIPVILGTARMGRMSLHAAQLVTGELGKCEGVQTELIDIAKLPLPTNDAGEAIKQAEFSANMSKADALVVVSPEYNHGYSGLLKHVLDSCLILPFRRKLRHGFACTCSVHFSQLKSAYSVFCISASRTPEFKKRP
jgi:NAD(P)H-dependent FMN reductase